MNFSATPAPTPGVLKDPSGQTLAPAGILLLQSNAVDAELAAAQLDEAGIEHRMERVETSPDFQACLQCKKYDLILADYNLPGFDGISALHMAREYSPETPFIFISGPVGEDLVIEALRQGAADYILKQRLERLGPAAVRALAEAREHGERKRSEQVRADRLAQIQTVLENIPEALVVLDAQGSVVSLNAAASDLYELKPDYAIRRHFEHFSSQLALFELNGHKLPFPDWPGSRVLRGERFAGWELLVRRVDTGREWIASYNGRPVFNAAGKLHLAVITIRCVTEKKAEMALSATDARLRVFMESDIIGVIVSDDWGKILDANDKFLLMVGYGREDLARNELNWVHITPVECLHLDDHAIAECRRRGACTPYEKEYIRKDGTRIPVLIGYARLPGSEGLNICYVLDLTAQKQAEMALRQEQEWLRIAVEAAHLGTWQFELSTRAINCSAHCKANFGLPPEAAVSYTKLLGLIHSEDLPRIRNAAQAAIAERRDYRCEYRVIWPDGSVHWLVASGRTLYDSFGQAVRMVGVTLDITDRKKAENELRRQAEELQQSNADLQRFAFAASHDLKEPLRAIRIYSELLLTRCKAQVGEEASRYLTIVASGAQRMTSLIDGLLSYSTVVHSGEQLRLVDCNEVLKVAIDNCSQAINETGAEITYGSLTVITGDSVQLVQLFQNLISNAIKYRSERPPRVEINAEEREADVLFSVRDNGMGIAPEYWTHIFAIFKRLHSQEHSGTGIGLAICQRIVERHGGRIWVESQPGEGSTFYFTIPRHDMNAHRL